jgi:hypothetical protein
MGFFDFLEKTFDAVGEAVTAVAMTPQVQYGVGYQEGYEGSPRRVVNLPRDDGSDEWQNLKSCIDAYNQGYNDGREERRTDQRGDDR